jgi:hypothetical protein
LIRDIDIVESPLIDETVSVLGSFPDVSDWLLAAVGTAASS